MKQHSAVEKPVKKKKVFDSVRGSLVHVAVFGIISISGHFATGALSAAAGAVGAGLVPPIGGMLLI
jgi:hypothetical protein